MSQVTQQLVIGGLLLMALSVFIALSLRVPENKSEEAYVYKGLAVAVFAVGAFNVGSGLADLLSAQMLLPDYRSYGGWLFAVPLALLFLSALSRGRKAPPPLVEPDGRRCRHRFGRSCGFRKRYG